LGTLLVTRDDFLGGLKEVEPSATREFFIEKSKSNFASLGGLQDVKKLLDAVIEHSHMRDEIYEQVGLAPPRGILLAGPSGTGKTAMAPTLPASGGGVNRRRPTRGPPEPVDRYNLFSTAATQLGPTSPR
jgi:SpoVK/Ycf46/Vps4 family AAA+-type ATPase